MTMVATANLFDTDRPAYIARLSRTWGDKYNDDGCTNFEGLLLFNRALRYASWKGVAFTDLMHISGLPEEVFPRVVESLIAQGMIQRQRDLFAMTRKAQLYFDQSGRGLSHRTFGRLAPKFAAKFGYPQEVTL